MTAPCRPSSPSAGTGSTESPIRRGGAHRGLLDTCTGAPQNGPMVDIAPRFDDRFRRELPGDPSLENRPRPVLGASWSPVEPTRVARPRLLAWSDEVARQLGVASADLARAPWVDVLGGNGLFDGMKPYAAAYGGHQFGQWAGQLGDGRAITLGELEGPEGRFELQLKGAGRTPYSRRGDGRAVMRSSVREFLMSEAMHHLGVPTTRALSLMATGDEVLRDMLYDGNARPEPGAIVCRVAPSFLRFGNFELPASRSDVELLRRLVRHTVDAHFPALAGRPLDDEHLGAWIADVATRTAHMVLGWMRVGFVHGVMNTDNMSILGLTIDYGPYGWLENYDPDWTPNTTDASGRRYRFGHQPRVAFWNLVRLAEAIAPLMTEPQRLETALESFVKSFEAGEARMLATKLGVGDDAADAKVVADLFPLFASAEIDMTIFYRALVDAPTDEAAREARWQAVLPAFYAPEVPVLVREASLLWLDEWAARARVSGGADDQRRAAMRAANPKYVLRNYLAQLAIDRAEQGDGAEVMALLEVLRRPYDDQPGSERYAEKRPEWARHRVGCSMLSCSS